MRLALPAGILSLLIFSSFGSFKKAKLKLPGEFVPVPGGTLALGSDKKPLEGFYMSKYEVTNRQYRLFLDEMAPGMAPEEREKIACDSTGWMKHHSYSEPMKKYYFNHPAYQDYPVVNIRYEGALQYCAWLRQKIQKENPGFTITVSLPSKEQQVWAGQGGRSQAMYPWGNFYLRNNKGAFLCNYNRVCDQSIYRDPRSGKPEVRENSLAVSGGLNDGGIYTANVKSYFPNSYGLYNISGNVAEMISEKGICMGGSWNDYGGDVQIRSEATYERSAPTVGFRPVITVTPLTK